MFRVALTKNTQKCEVKDQSAATVEDVLYNLISTVRNDRHYQTEAGISCIQLYPSSVNAMDCKESIDIRLIIVKLRDIDQRCDSRYT